MHSNAKAQHLPKSTALLYNLSYQLVLQPTAPGHILQIFLRVTIQNQIRIAQRVIVDEVVQFCPLRYGHIQRILDSGAIDGNFSPIPELQLHASGVHVKMTNSCIVLHVHVLLKSCCGLYRSIYDFGFHLPRTPALNFPKKTNNPNPSPIGNKFGLFLFGPPDIPPVEPFRHHLPFSFFPHLSPLPSTSFLRHVVQHLIVSIAAAFYTFFHVHFN